MQTALPELLLNTPDGQEADRILRSCVHCGFCTSACPTYQLLGNELDSPRGRIYLIKAALEGEPISQASLTHLDRCLTCRSCETACPSDVAYGRLVDIGRQHIEQQIKRPYREKIKRYLLRKVVPYPRRFGPLLKLGRWLRPLLPTRLRQLVPIKHAAPTWPPPRHPRRVLCLDGCAQSNIAPHFNAIAANVLDSAGISLVRIPGCCGAISHHLGAQGEALQTARRNLDNWWPQVDEGVEAIMTTASGCATMLQDYAHLLRNDPDYADKARRLQTLLRDPVQILETADLSRLHYQPRRIAFHSPCSLQHGMRLHGRVEALLTQLGFELCQLSDAEACCGSAGTYSLLQPALSKRLLQRKLADLTANHPELIATANIGCYTQLQSGTETPVVHWLELLHSTL